MVRRVAQILRAVLLADERRRKPGVDAVRATDATARHVQDGANHAAFSGTLHLVPSTRSTRNWVPIATFGLWACGFASVALIRFRGWRRIRAGVRCSTPIDLPVAVEVRSS